MTGTEEELKKRLKENSWPINTHTRHKQDLKSGDKVIIYHGGRFGKKGFVGTLNISSKIAKSDLTDYAIRISNPVLWKNEVRIDDILGSLGFITRKDNWGIYFQGGVSRLQKNDYDTILSAVK